VALIARTATVASAAILALFAVVAVHNAFTYPSIGGYDAAEYISYARGIADDGVLPLNGAGAYYTPPGYMAIAGLMGSLGRALDMQDPDHLGQLVNALASVATGVLVFLIARVLWPARPVTWLASVGFFAFFPVVLKTGAMFHPEPLRDVDHRRGAARARADAATGSYSWKLALCLGLLLGAGQLVRAWSIWMVGIAVVVLAAVAILDRTLRRSALAAGGIALSWPCSCRCRGMRIRRRATRIPSSTARRRIGSCSCAGRSRSTSTPAIRTSSSTRGRGI
jgi:hypothetical protein